MFNKYFIVTYNSRVYRINFDILYVLSEHPRTFFNTAFRHINGCSEAVSAFPKLIFWILIHHTIYESNMNWLKLSVCGVYLCICKQFAVYVIIELNIYAQFEYSLSVMEMDIFYFQDATSEIIKISRQIVYAKAD